MVKRFLNWCAVTHGHDMIETDDGIYVLASDYDALAARLAEAEAFIQELQNESAEDWRTRKYVVVQMTEETWDKLLAWKPADIASHRENDA